MFSTATGVRAFQYIPVDEDFVIELAARRVALCSTVGPFSFDIKGAVSRWDAPALDFAFSEVDVKLFGAKVFTKVIASPKPKTYTWYFADARGVAAARSSAGGLSLMRR